MRVTRLVAALAATTMLCAPAAADANWQAALIPTAQGDVLGVAVLGSVSVSVRGTDAAPYLLVSGPGSSAVDDVACKKTASDTATCTGNFVGVLVEGDDTNDNITIHLGHDDAGALYGQVYGGAGNDTINGGSSSVNEPVLDISGEAGDDKLTGSAGDDTLDGGEGNDILSGGAGDDTLNGGAGDDTLAGSGGADVLSGGPGMDNTGSDFSRGGQDLNITVDGQPNDGIAGERDNVQADIEVFSLQGTTVNFVGSDNAERVSVDVGSSGVIDGRGGPDRLVGRDGNETLLGGDGDDYLEGGFGHDILDGGAGIDQFVGDATARDTVAIVGNDTIRARDGNPESVDCGIGADSAQVDANDIVAPTCESIELPPPPPPPPVPAPAPANVFKLAKTPSIAAFVKSGLVVRQGCAAACKVTATLVVDKATASKLGTKTIGSAKATLKKAGEAKLTLKLNAKLKRKVKRLKTLKVTLRVAVAGGATETRVLTLKR